MAPPHTTKRAPRARLPPSTVPPQTASLSDEQVIAEQAPLPEPTEDEDLALSNGRDNDEINWSDGDMEVDQVVMDKQLESVEAPLQQEEANKQQGDEEGSQKGQSQEQPGPQAQGSQQGDGKVEGDQKVQGDDLDEDMDDDDEDGVVTVAPRNVALLRTAGVPMPVDVNNPSRREIMTNAGGVSFGQIQNNARGWSSFVQGYQNHHGTDGSVLIAAQPVNERLIYQGKRRSEEFNRNLRGAMRAGDTAENRALGKRKFDENTQVSQARKRPALPAPEPPSRGDGAPGDQVSIVPAAAVPPRFRGGFMDQASSRGRGGSRGRGYEQPSRGGRGGWYRGGFRGGQNAAFHQTPHYTRGSSHGGTGAEYGGGGRGGHGSGAGSSQSQQQVVMDALMQQNQAIMQQNQALMQVLQERDSRTQRLEARMDTLMSERDQGQMVNDQSASEIQNVDIEDTRRTGQLGRREGSSSMPQDTFKDASDDVRL